MSEVAFLDVRMAARCRRLHLVTCGGLSRNDESPIYDQALLIYY